jgi:DNA-binding transcriptional MerR regulator
MSNLEAAAASSTLRYLESKLTDAELERCQRLRFIQDCKAKGFKDLEAKGLLKRDTRGPTVSRLNAEKAERIAREAERLVNDELMSIPKVAKQFGVAPQTIKNYCNTYGIKLMRYFEATRIKDKGVIDKAQPLLLEGETLAGAERTMGLRTGRIYKAMQRLHLYYDGKQIKSKEAHEEQEK